MTRRLGRTVLVIPCFNERERFKTTAFLECLRTQESVHLILVDEGSNDGTWEVLYGMRQEAREESLSCA